MESLTSADVQAALDRHGLAIKMQFFDTSTATSQQASDNIGCQLGQIVKSLAFIIDGQPVLVLTSGDRRVDTRKLAAKYEVRRKKVKAAKPEQCIEIYGYAPGGVPPLGHRTPNIPTYMDESLKRYQTVYAAGGAHNAIFAIQLDQLVQATGGAFMDVKED